MWKKVRQTSGLSEPCHLGIAVLLKLGLVELIDGNFLSLVYKVEIQPPPQ